MEIMKKTLIIFALVLAMMLQLVPFSAFAAEETAESEVRLTESESQETEPAAEPEETEPVTEPVAETEPSVTEPAAEPAQTEPAQTEPAQTEPAQEELVIEQAGQGEVALTHNPVYPALSGKKSERIAQCMEEMPEAEAPQLNATYDKKVAAQTLTAGLEARKGTITVYLNTYSVLEEDDFWDVWDYAMEHNGIPTQGDYLYWHWTQVSGQWNWQRSGGVYYNTIYFYVDYYTTAYQEQKVTEKLNQVINGFGFNAATTDYEKAYTIYDWVTRNIDYDYSGLNRGDPMAQTCYKGVMQGTTVCQGYASTMYRMLLQVGVDCRVVAGDAESYSTPNYTGDDHGWNIAKINGKWYNLDSTWDDENTPAYWDWFLLNNYNFYDHTRWSEYRTSSFNNKYPMASSNFNPSVYTGVMNVMDGYMGYYINGFLQKDYTGFLEVNGKYYYAQNGIIDLSLISLKESSGRWYFVENGVWNSNFTDLVYYNDTWFYAVNGVVDWTYTGLVPYNGNYFYVQNNVLDWSYTSLGYHQGSWYFIQNGLLQRNYTGLVYFNNEWFYVEQGLLTYEYFGMVEYQGNYFYVQASHLDWNYTGLGYHNGGWYFIQNALMQKSYTGFVEFNGEWFYVQQGVLTFAYTGLVYYNGNYFYVEASRIRWDYTGYVLYNGGYYYVENGVMRW